jgi:hypothetical protein
VSPVFTCIFFPRATLSAFPLFSRPVWIPARIQYEGAGIKAAFSRGGLFFCGPFSAGFEILEVILSQRRAHDVLCRDLRGQEKIAEWVKGQCPISSLWDANFQENGRGVGSVPDSLGHVGVRREHVETVRVRSQPLFQSVEMGPLAHGGVEQAGRWLDGCVQVQVEASFHGADAVFFGIKESPVFAEQHLAEESFSDVPPPGFFSYRLKKTLDGDKPVRVRHKTELVGPMTQHVDQKTGEFFDLESMTFGHARALSDERPFVVVKDSEFLIRDREFPKNPFSARLSCPSPGMRSTGISPRLSSAP